MGEIKKTYRNLIFYSKSPSLTYHDLKKFKTAVPYHLPQEYINLLKVSNGLRLDYDFVYRDIYSERFTESAIGYIYGVNAPEYNYMYDIINNYKHPPEFFPKGILGFAETGNGDIVAFDYRNFSSDPPVLYWNHEEEEGKDLSFIANNFGEFLNILKEPIKPDTTEEDFQKWLINLK